MPAKVAIIGVGLLGGSIALGLKRKKGFQVVGWNHRASSRKKAARLVKVAHSFEEAVTDAEIILLCAHSSSIGEDLRKITPLAHPNVLIMDISSVKGGIVEGALKVPGIAYHFVPCHPMAGKEKSGPSFAEATLYQGKVIFITPLLKTPSGLIRRARSFWKGLGAVPVLTDPRTHDRAVALTSHLPHLLASAMMVLYGRKGQGAVPQKAVGSGFRDFTRIAGGNPSMWRDIVEMNHEEILKALREFKKVIGSMEKNLKKGKGAYWVPFFENAKEQREKLP
jgi:prephenate dehydrogenase